MAAVVVRGIVVVRRDVAVAAAAKFDDDQRLGAALVDDDERVAAGFHDYDDRAAVVVLVLCVLLDRGVVLIRARVERVQRVVVDPELVGLVVDRACLVFFDI